MIRPEIEQFIVVVRARGIEWDDLLGGKAERFYDHLAERYPGLDPVVLAEHLPLNDLQLYRVACEVNHSWMKNERENT